MLDQSRFLKPTRSDLPPSERESWGFRLCLRVVLHPRLVLILCAISLFVSAGIASQILQQRSVFTCQPLYADSALEGFPRGAEVTYDTLVFWCQDDCDLNTNYEFLALLVKIQKVFEQVHRQDPNCKHLGYSSIGHPGEGTSNSTYLSEDSRVSMFEFHYTDANCGKAIRKKLEPFMRTDGNLLAALGGSESVGLASLKKNVHEALHHVIISIPFSTVLLWMVLGNFWQALTPCIAFGMSFLSGIAMVVIAKWIFPVLNVNFDDGTTIFVVLALCMDYALFFWTTFRAERPKADSMESALAMTIARSGHAILVSNVFVVTAYIATLTLPCLNMWAYRGLFVSCGWGCFMSAVYSVTFPPAIAVLLPRLFDHGESKVNSLIARFWSFLPNPEHMWSWWARIITRRPFMCVIPVLVYGGMVPFLLCLPKYVPNFDANESGRRPDAIETTASDLLQEHFNPGMIMPVAFVLEAKLLGEAQDLHAVPADYASMLQVNWVTASTQVHNISARSTPLTRAQIVESMESHNTSHGLGPRAAIEMLEFPNIWMDWESLRHEMAVDTRSQKSDCVAPSVSATITKDGSTAKLYDGESLVLTEEFGRAVCEFASDIVRTTKGKAWQINREDMISMWWLPRKAEIGATFGSHGPDEFDDNVHPALYLIRALQAIGGKNPIDSMPPELRAMIPSILRTSLSTGGNKLEFFAMPTFGPTSKTAKSFDDVIRESLVPARKTRTFDVNGKRYQLEVKHTSAMQVEVDASHELNAAIPIVLGVYLPFVCIAVGLTFRSAFLALKLGLTLIIPIATVFGMAVAIYQMHWLDFMNLTIVHGSGGIDFRAFIMTAGILFGFAMDYDLFLFIRVYEYRSEGFDNHSAVKRALVETGPVITTAGTLMAIQFASVWCLNCLIARIVGFIYFMGVVFDVFIIRMMIAPVFLSVAENLNYWPKSMPPGTKQWPKQD